MRYLADAHALIWAVQESPRLSTTAREVLSTLGNEIFISAASGWEIATKFRLGKLPNTEVELLVYNFPGSLRRLGFRELPVTLDHSVRAGLLPGAHRDPFDRLLIAQAQAENLILVSNERAFDAYGVNRVW